MTDAGTPPERALHGQVALVTGGGSGIGGACALRLAQRGAAVAIVDVDEAATTRLTAQAADSKVVAVTADLADVTAVERVVPEVVRQLGRLDILVNNVGIFTPVGLQGTTYELWQRLVSVNLGAALFFTKFAAQAMVRQGDGGRIVNIGSAAGHQGGGNPVYASIKAALGGLTRSSAAELARSGINVNAVAPGLTVTEASLRERSNLEFLQQMVTDGAERNFFGRLSLPSDVASAVTYLCLPESRQITGQVIHVSAGTVV
jgi:NAD(P)-dependent dehydrogenase (short-subunit alcohol dehydrogenase family)